MKLSDFVCFDAVVGKLESSDRNGVIAELVTKLGAAGKVPKKLVQEIIDAVVDRENEASTGIGKGVAVPHVKHGSIKNIVATIGCSSEGIDFASLDKQPVYTVILLLSPDNNADKHLQAMENIFKNLQNDDFRRFLRQSQTAEEIKEVLHDFGQE
jgi:nitrogen PTS system EIIA component